jgi:DNA helicase-2/ATP-dependent DNA helicase PcrA
VGETSVDLLLEAAEASGRDLLSASAEAADTLRGKARAGAKEFLSIVSAIAETLSAPQVEGETLAALVERLVRSSGLVEYHRSQDEVAGTQKVANLEELVNAASLYPRSPEGLADFLETIELDRILSSEEGGAADAVTLITMHNTKGLEFPVVIATGIEQGLFPREDEEGEELEEQRRLFYVAVTRAKDELHLCACHWRRLHGRLYETAPSRFLSEIDPSLLDVVGGRKATRDYAGSGFVGAASVHGGGDSASEAHWRAGMAVYHDDYGSGVIVKVSPTPSSGPLVVVRFETGRQAQFFPKFTKKLEPQKG